MLVKAWWQIRSKEALTLLNCSPHMADHGRLKIKLESWFQRRDVAAEVFKCILGERY